MVLVTGATSQVGILLLKELVDEGFKVRCLVRQSSDLENIKAFNVELIFGDIEDKKELAAAIENVEYIVHIAGIWRVESLLEVCKKSNTLKKVIFIGSTSRFKKLDSTDEHEYQLALKMAMAEETITSSGLNTVILRPTMLYGLDRDKNVLQIINFMSKYHFYPVIGTGRASKHPVYVGDVVAAIMQCIDNDSIIKKEYVIAGKYPIEYMNMLKTIRNELGKRVFLFPVPLFTAYIALWFYKRIRRNTYLNYAMLKRVDENMIYDITSAQRDFGYNPISFEEGIKKQITYLKAKEGLKR
jgi:nucleoside-diphosphate-sugar epimerase